MTKYKETLDTILAKLELNEITIDECADMIDDLICEAKDGYGRITTTEDLNSQRLGMSDEEYRDMICKRDRFLGDVKVNYVGSNGGFEVNIDEKIWY